MTEHENIELRSEEVQEVLGTPPGWMARFGTLLALIAFVILGYVGYMIEYPDTVEAGIQISSSDPPKRLVTQMSGRIGLIRVENESRVQAEEVLMVFDNQAYIEDVLTLEDAILAVKNPTDSTLLAFAVPGNLVLGDLKNSLFDFYARQSEYQRFLSSPRDRLTQSQQQREIEKMRTLTRSDEERLANINRQIASVESRLREQERLVREGLQAERRLDAIREELLNLQRIRESIESSIKSRSFDVERIRSEMSGLRVGTRENQAEAAAALLEGFRRLQRSVSEWKSKFVISSPIDGIVSLDLQQISEQQFVEENREVGVVVPLQQHEVKGIIQIDASQSVKVENGQKVIIKLDSYAFAEHGALIGRLSSKSQVPIDGKITVEVLFPDGLVTTLGRRLDPSREMRGQAAIVTVDKRLIQRVFEGIRGRASS
jgi:multidrug resistance efflux pump